MYGYVAWAEDEVRQIAIWSAGGTVSILYSIVHAVRKRLDRELSVLYTLMIISSRNLNGEAVCKEKSETGRFIF